jgi:hypothetical protein
VLSDCPIILSAEFDRDLAQQRRVQRLAACASFAAFIADQPPLCLLASRRLALENKQYGPQNRP